MPEGRDATLGRDLDAGERANRRKMSGRVTVGAAAALDPEAAATSNGADDLLVLSAVYKQWGRRPILRGVDLSVPRGALVAVSGPNGAGKTTLLRLAAGLIHAESGSVAVEGLHPERDRRAYLGRLGFLSAGDRALYARLSARRHLDLSARLGLMRARDRGAAVEQALVVFGLGDFADRRADRLSTGQRQRVRLAMTFVRDPPLALMDEPSNSLDQEGMAVLSTYLERLRRRGGSALWCIPDGLQTSLPCDIVLRLADGRLQAA